MSKQTKHRYFNSFFITTFIYLVASFFLFYVFADTLIVEEKKQDEVKTISLQHVALMEKPTPVQEVEPEPIVEPVVETPKPIKKKVEKPKKHHKKEKKPIKKPIDKPVEKVVEQIQEVTAPIQESKVVEKVETLPISKPTLSANEKENLESEYLSKIRFHIEKNKVYPKVAKRLKQTGKVHVKFVISKNGEIKHYKVHKNSPFENLDKAALEILEKIAKFEPIPEKLDKDSWEITVPIVYQIARN